MDWYGVGGIMASLRDQVENATLTELGGGIAGWTFELIENGDGTVTGRITDGYEIGGGTAAQFPFEATFDLSQFEDVPTTQYGENGEVTAPDWQSLDPVESDAPSALEKLANTPIAPGGPTAATSQTATDVVAELAGMDLESDRIFVTNAPGNREAGRSVSLYESASKDRAPIGSILLESGGDLSTVFSALSDVSPADVRRLDNSQTVSGTEGSDFAGDVADAAAARDTRRELRNSLDSALEAEGYDPSEWNTDARADGTLILQDPETNRTRTIEAGDDLDSTVDSFGGDSDVQPESDGGGSGEQGGDGLDRRAIGAGLIVAAAAAYGVLQK